MPCKRLIYGRTQIRRFKFNEAIVLISYSKDHRLTKHWLGTELILICRLCYEYIRYNDIQTHINRNKMKRKKSCQIEHLFIEFVVSKV